MSTINKVKDFHTTFNVNIGNTPSLPPIGERMLRVNLMFEELCEFALSMGPEVTNHLAIILGNKKEELSLSLERGEVKENIVESLDALIDLRYVTDGTVLQLGLQDVHKSAFNEVHYTNMAKAHLTEEQALVTSGFYHKQNVDNYIREKEGYYIVYRKSDNKVLKPHDWKAPNLKQFFSEK